MQGNRDESVSAGGAGDVDHNAAKVGRELVVRPRAGLPVPYVPVGPGGRDEPGLSPLEQAAAVSGAMRGVLETGYETARSTLGAVAPLLEEEFFAPTPSDRLALMGSVAGLVNQANAALVRHATELAADLRFEFADRHSVLNVAAEEIGNALGIAPFTASRWIKAGRQVFGRLYLTGDMFMAGVLSVEKVCAIAEALARVGDPLAFAVQDEILPKASSLTPREITREIARLLIELDPEGADERHGTARRRRYVSRPRAAADGMASFNVFMPADHAACVNTVLERSAAAAKAAGDTRSRQEVRTDTLASLAVTALREGTTVTVGGHVEVPPTKVNVTVPLEVLARTLPDWEGHPSPLARIHDDIMGAEESGSPAPGRTATTATSPESTATSPSGEPSGPAGPDCGATNRGSPSTGEHEATAPDPTIPDPTIPDSTGPDLTAADPDTTTSETPSRDGRLECAWLEGYGPIAPAVAILLAAGGTWRRIVTDALDGRPLDVGRASYRPPAHIAVAVAVRDKTCSRPGCDSPALYCEQDHFKEWWKGGTTAVHRLMLLCRRCHRAKTLGAGEFLNEDTNGRRVWKSPLGAIYTGPEPRPPRKHIREPAPGKPPNPPDTGDPPPDPSCAGEPPPETDPGPPPF